MPKELMPRPRLRCKKARRRRRIASDAQRLSLVACPTSADSWVGSGSMSSRTTSGRLARPATISAARSEEHTSELQSLMRISYAVFCLKKKNTKLDYYHLETHNTSSL